MLKYSGDVVLPGTCADFSFNIEFAERSPSVDNIANALGSSFFAPAFLNNVQGNNDSPQFNTDIFRTICVQRHNSIHFTAKNPDSDSVLYRLVDLKQADGTCGSDSVYYEPGYSAQQPIAVDSLNSAVFNSMDGLMSVVPVNQGFYQVAIEVADYRWDSLYYKWNKIGSSYCDIPIIAYFCDSASNYYGGAIDSSAANVSFDTISNEWGLQALCGDTNLTITYRNDIDVSTVAEDGSDFWMLDPNKTTFPIMGASSGGALGIDKIKLDFAFPLTQNGRYILRYKTGNDNNTIASMCGYFVRYYDSIVVDVTGCSGVGVEENTLKNGFAVYPNPTKDILKFSLQGESTEFEYAVFNLQGQQLAGGFGDECNLGDLPSGTYVLICKHPDANFVERIVVR